MDDNKPTIHVVAGSGGSFGRPGEQGRRIDSSIRRVDKCAVVGEM